MIPARQLDKTVTGGSQPNLPGAFPETLPETPDADSATQHNELHSNQTPRSHGLTDTALSGENTSSSNTPSGNYTYQQKGAPAPVPRTQGIDVFPLTEKGTAGAPQQAAGGERGSSKPGFMAGADSRIGNNHNNSPTSDSIQGRQPTGADMASSGPYSQKDVSAVPESTTRSDDRHVHIKGSGPTPATEAAAAATAAGSERDNDHHQPRGTGDKAANSEGITTRVKESLVGAYNTVDETARSQDITTRVKEGLADAYNTVVGQGSHDENAAADNNSEIGGPSTAPRSSQRTTGDEAARSQGIPARVKERLDEVADSNVTSSEGVTTRVKEGVAGAYNTVVGQGNHEKTPGAGHNSELRVSSSPPTSSQSATRDEVAKPEPIPTRMKEALAGAGVHNTVIGAGSNEEDKSAVNYQRAFPLMPSEQASHAPDDSTKQRRDSPSKFKENLTEAGVGAGDGASPEQTRGDSNPYAQKHVTDVPRAQPEPKHHHHGREDEKQRSPQDYASSYDVGNPYTQEHPSTPSGTDHGATYLNYGSSGVSTGTGAAAGYGVREMTGRDTNSTGFDNGPYAQKDVSAVPEESSTSGRDSHLGRDSTEYSKGPYTQKDVSAVPEGDTTSSQHEPTVTTGTTEGSVPAETNAHTRGAGAYTRADPTPQHHHDDSAKHDAAGAGATAAGAAASRAHQKATDDDNKTRSSPKGLRKPSASAQDGNGNDTAPTRSSADSSRSVQYKVLSSGTPSGVNLDNKH
ncbi:hypothetical protein DL764_006742 [Monosporascus ibericus]|uniref:Uncharacterized protein n=1 Tax=Monosporascus ibericus TaxID=155417 RepID=A0A4Q4T720_9PEZI|nr:hypothetical protein DL764_006742 [Monosporascus ibericus]